MRPHRAAAPALVVVLLGLFVAAASGRDSRALRRLKQDANDTLPSPLDGLEAGAPIPCEFVVFFKSSNVSVDVELTSLVQYWKSSQEPRAASVDDGKKNITAADIEAMGITTVLGRVTKPGGDSPLIDFNSSSTNPQSGNCTKGDDSCTKPYPQDRFIKALLLKVCAEDPDGARLLQRITGAPAVTAVVPNRVARTQQAGAGISSLLESPAVGRVSTTQAPASISWSGCMRPGMGLAWRGRRCTQDSRQTEWMTVYAFYTATGREVGDCVKQRESLTSAEADIWLGRCGVLPTVMPNPLPAAVCMDQKDSSNATYSQQASFVHPKASCGKGKPINMMFSGRVCRFDPGLDASLLQWTLARPVPGQPNVATTGCDIKLTGKGAATAADAKKYLGWCGEMPSRAPGLMICAVPKPPPPSPSPPPPPPSPPPPESPKTLGLDMEYRIVGEADPTLLKRIRAVTADDRVPAESNWNKGKPAAVAVIDSGMFCEHPDLNVVYSNFSFVKPGDACTDPLGHGTHIAGLIGGKNNGLGMVGSAPGVPLLSFRVIKSRGTFSSASDITGAVNEVLNFKPPKNKAHHAPVVVNLSLEFSLLAAAKDNLTQFLDADRTTRRAAIAAQMQAWCETFQKLQDAGIMPVAAAGNGGKAFSNGPDSEEQTLPAACDGVLAVTAVRPASDAPNRDVDEAAVFHNDSDPKNYSASSYAWSTADEGVLARTIAAPGFASYSTMAPGSWHNNPLLNPLACQAEPTRWCALSGTSQAAATVSGLVARCYAAGACSLNMTQAERLAAIVGRSKEYNQQHPEFGFRNDPAAPQPGGQSDGSARPYYGWLIDGGMYIS